MDGLAELLKLFLRARYSFALWVTAAIVLFVPLPDAFQFKDLPTEYRRVIGPIFLVSLIVWLIETGLTAYDCFKAKKVGWDEDKTIVQFLETLSPAETKYLSQAVERNQQTILAHDENQQIRSLEAKGLIKATAGKSPEHTVPYVIPHSVWRILLKMYLKPETQKPVITISSVIVHPIEKKADSI